MTRPYKVAERAPAKAGARSAMNPEIPDDGKEGCVRETQEGCPALLKSIVFQNFKKF